MSGYTFTAGKTYITRYIVDSSLQTPVYIHKRTAKTIWFSTRKDKADVQRARVQVDRDGEFIYPEGRYSMAPVCHAKRIAKEATPAATPPPVEVVKVVKMAAAPQQELPAPQQA